MVQLTGDQYYLLALTLSWVLGFLPLFLGKRMTWVQCVGLALVVHPFVRMGLNLVRTYELLFVPTVLQPVSEVALWWRVEGTLWRNLVLPMIGLFLLHNPYGDAGKGAPRRERFEDALAAHGVGARHSLRKDAQRGLSLFAFIAGAYLLAYVASKYVAPIVAPGSDESLYWRNITIPLIVLVSLSAGLAEEFLFRGVLLSWLGRWMPFALAALVQAVFFGFIHAGYGTWTHVLGPMAFGLGMAWVARHLGVVVTALLHAQINVVFFTIDVGPTYLAVNGAWGLVALSSVSLALLAACAWSLRETRADAVRIRWSNHVAGVRALARLVVRLPALAYRALRHPRRTLRALRLGARASWRRFLAALRGDDPPAPDEPAGRAS